MNELWQKRLYPITFQLCTGSKFDRVELYGTFQDGDWSKPIVQLSYAYQKNPGEFIYSEIVNLLPGDYEYKFYLNQKDWKVNSTIKMKKDNNILVKEDFVQMILDQYDRYEKKECDDRTRYHDVASILYHEQTFHDLELIVNETHHFKIHRAILAAGSDYFKTLFQSQSNQNSLVIKTDQIETFSWMLKFLYTGTISRSTLTFDQTESLIKLARTYRIPILLKTLINLITEKIDANNSLHLLFMKDYFEEQWINIRKNATAISAKNFLYICHQEKFVELPLDILTDILNHPNILIPNQAMYHTALMRWSKNREEYTISEYLIANLHQESFRKCYATYKIPSSIVCFFVDGSERYTKMTVTAINSFLKTTPHVMVGLLLMDLELKKSIFSQIDRIYHYRILCKRVSENEILSNWNPTQYKLDIIKFAHDGFEEIFWMDSDTIVYKDMTSVLSEFRSSSQLFYFISDHVMFDKTFLKNWREEHPETLIPQACFMGLKSSIISSFFLRWKQSWMKWIEPKPFSNYKDPNPTFSGSAFCIEQYALGNAIHHFITEHASTAVLNGTLLTQYIKNIDRTLVMINIGPSEETQIMKEKEKLNNLSNTSLLSLTSFTSFTMVSVHLYSLIPLYSYISQQGMVQTSVQGSFARITGNINSVKFSHIIDRYFDCFFHFYNHNYDIAYQWYLKNCSPL